MNEAVLVSLPFVGLLLGGLGTFMGTGGGFLFVPALLLLFPREEPGVIATISLVAVVVSALSGTVRYGHQSRIDYRTSLVLAMSMIPGAILGALTTNVLDRELFQFVFGALFMALAVYLFLLPSRSGGEGNAIPSKGGVRSLTDAVGRIFTYRVHRVSVMAVGFTVGFIGGMLGIGGGSILMTSMVGFLGFPAQVATGTSQFAIAVSSLAAVGTHLSHITPQEVWLQALLLAVGVGLGAQVGTWLSIRSDSRLIERSLAVAMVVVGAWLVRTAL